MKTFLFMVLSLSNGLAQAQAPTNGLSTLEDFEAGFEYAQCSERKFADAREFLEEAERIGGYSFYDSIEKLRQRESSYADALEELEVECARLEPPALLSREEAARLRLMERVKALTLGEYAGLIVQEGDSINEMTIRNDRLLASNPWGLTLPDAVLSGVTKLLLRYCPAPHNVVAAVEEIVNSVDRS